MVESGDHLFVKIFFIDDYLIRQGGHGQRAPEGELPTCKRLNLRFLAAITRYLLVLMIYFYI